MNPPQSIALFGGTFDPIHCGHLLIANEAVKALSLDQVRFLPCRLSPHKTHLPPTSPEHRLAMIRLAIRDLPWAVIDDFDLKAPEPSYSYLTVAATRRQFPQARIYWLMGCDQWEALPRWRRPEVLAAEVEFIVFTRGAEPQAREGWQLHPLQAEHPASSTLIRESIHTDHPPSDWLPPSVYSYILEHHLYTA